MTEEQSQLLRQSRDSRQLKQTALSVLDSHAPADFDRLGEFLGSAEFLERLDGPKAYEGTYTSLRLARVIKKLMDSREPAVGRVLLRLISASAYQAHILRIQLLVRALAVIRPSPPEAVAYWNDKSQPGSPLAHDVIASLCINQSDPAMVLLEHKLADPKHAEQVKVSWLRQIILPRRNDEPLLACCERLLQRPVSAESQLHIAEALFDYQPAEWYRGCSPPEPPPRSLASPRAKETFRRIARHLLERVPVGPELAARIQAGLREIGDAREPM